MSQVTTPRTAEAREIVRSCVGEGRLDRRVYTDPEIFKLEQALIFARVWHYVGHVSELSKPGDYATREFAGQPVILLRSVEGDLKAFFNRCSHRGAVLTFAEKGHAEKFICSYHAWTFNLDGQLKGLPYPQGYESTPVSDRRGEFGLVAVPRFESFHGFLFASLASDGPSLADYLGPAAANLLNMVERSPTGRISPFGGVARMTQRNNWKIYLENLHDGAHAFPTHQSSIEPARVAGERSTNPWAKLQAAIVAANAQTPMKMSQLVVNCFPSGHSEMMAFRESRPPMAGQLDYEAALALHHGPAKAAEILQTDRHASIFYPNVSITPTFMQLRVIVPVSVDETRVDVYSFKLEGAPDEINRRTIAYSNAINSPASLVRADDLENFERVQTGLGASPNPWVSVHRELAAEPTPHGRSHAMSERFIRNQFSAWAQYMEAAQ